MSASLYVDSKPITSFETILAELTRLDQKLPRDGLNQFVVFNKAYFVVTHALSEAANQNYFKNPRFVESFTVNFARYYFDALNQTVAKDPRLPTAWAILNQTGRRTSAPNFILLLMGANAHINHDLPLVFLKLMDKGNTDDLFKDVLKVDKLLMKSGKNILTTFEEPSRRLDFLKRRFVFIYYRPVMYMILYWRVGTWRNYRRIKTRGIEASGYAKRSIRTAKRFALLAKILEPS